MEKGEIYYHKQQMQNGLHQSIYIIDRIEENRIWCHCIWTIKGMIRYAFDYETVGAIKNQQLAKKENYREIVSLVLGVNEYEI